MSDKLNPKIVSMSLASVAGIVYILCAIFFAIAPLTTLSFFKDIFHGVDLTQLARTTISFGNTVAGFVEIVVSALVTGWMFAVMYNYLLTKMK